MGTGALSPGVKRRGREADRSHSTSAEVKKKWIYTSNPPYAFMAWCLISWAQEQLYLLPQFIFEKLFAPVNILAVMLCIRAEKHVGIHAMCPFFFILNLTQCQISRQSIR
jgi:hypothetical protein